MIPSLEISHWSEGRSVGVSLMAQQATVSAEAVHGVLEILRTGKHMEKLPSLPPVAEWLKLYRSQWRILKVLVDGFCPSEDSKFKTSDCAKLFLRGLRHMARLSVEERKAELMQLSPEKIVEMYKIGTEFGRDLYNSQLDDIRDDIAGKEPEGDEELRKRVWHLPEMQFFFRVYVPCLVLYGDYPNRMMRKARNGDIDAICDLLRLDKHVMAEPRIAEEFAKAHLIKGRARFRRMAKALALPCKSVKRHQVKNVMMGYISKVAEGLGTPVDAPEIKNLFDLTARDYGKGASDTDIPAGETLTKRVQRARAGWRVIPDPPKKAGQKPVNDTAKTSREPDKNRG